jgi:hypothetical protein
VRDKLLNSHFFKKKWLQNPVLRVDLNPEPENCSVQKRTTYQNDFGNSDRCKREYLQYRTWVELGSGVRVSLRGSGPQGALPLDWHHEQVSLNNI